MKKADRENKQKRSGFPILVILLITLLALTGFTFLRALSLSRDKSAGASQELMKPGSGMSDPAFSPKIKTLTELPYGSQTNGPAADAEPADEAGTAEESPNPLTGTVFMREYPEIISTVYVENLSGYDCCILMHLISVDRVIQKFYVRAGDTCSMPVSNGTYNIFAVIAGKEDALWFGPEKYFGADGEEVLIGEKIGIPWRETVNITVGQRNEEGSEQVNE